MYGKFLYCVVITVKMWSLRGGLVHTFRGHSRAVTSIVVHPVKPSIIVTASLDGSVRMWSLNTMEILYRWGRLCLMYNYRLIVGKNKIGLY